ETLDVRFDGEQIWLQGAEVGTAVRSETAGMTASRVSALAPVRQGLLNLQRRFQRLPGLVADGRDMGTVIFPNAALKVYLTASAEQRAERRYKQLISKGKNATIADVLADLQRRDQQDMSRQHAPLKPAQDAVLLDNSEQTIDQSVQTVLNWWNNQRPFKRA
ncbi:MAG: hypothetical protein RL323_1114, partial [Pseudomonadota bacterium]